MIINSINEISIDDIRQLKDLELSKLLHLLIQEEAKTHNLQDWDGSVPFNITSGDAGNDGRIIWNGNPAKTEFITNNFTIYQNKATPLIASACKEEILATAVKGEPRKLKEQIKNLVEKDGCYVLFNSRPMTDQSIKDRKKEFRKAIKLAGHANHATFEILIYDSNKIKDWTNKYISAVTLVQGFRGITRPQGFILWEKLNILNRFNENEFVADDTINANVDHIRGSIIEEKVLRVYGHSGLGKTRLVFEAFRDNDLQQSMVYYNHEGSTDISQIKNYILSHQEKQRGIIVIDNCDVKTHNILSNLVKSVGELRIITIGFDDNSSVEELKIKVDSKNQKDLVKEIIETKLPDHKPSDKEYVNTISEGYPWMAIRFCDIVLKEGFSELNLIPLNQFIEKLIFGSSPKEREEYEVIRACSVFSAFGFMDDSFRTVIHPEVKKSLEEQEGFIRTRVFDGEISKSRFKEIVIKFKEEDIIERRGVFLVVKPTVLAINLAADWLLKTDADKIIEIIDELKQMKLRERFFDRLKDLDQIEKAKEIVAELWGANTNFGTAEVLNTSWGSLLFRYVVEVNPKEMAKTVFTAFGNLSKHDISGIKEGRRNLVWSLEKLCFRKETFNLSAKVLYSFAVSENETWGNNATNQFSHLYQLMLAGTETPLLDRLSVIKWGLEKQDDDYTRIGIEAIGKGLVNDHYHRMGGAEQQGSGAPLVDYTPNWSEISNYRSQIVDILVEIACAGDLNSELAKKKLARAIRSMFKDRQEMVIVNALNKVIDNSGGVWIDALNALKMTLEFEKNLPKNIEEMVDGLIQRLTPTDLKNKLLLRVSLPEWDTYEKDENGNYIDNTKIRAEKFAEEIVEEDLPWLYDVKDLLQGEQRQGFNFGVKLGSIIKDVDKVIKVVLINLREIEVEKQNPEFVAGLLVGADDRKLVEEVIDSIIDDDVLNRHVFYITRINKPTYKEVQKLFRLIDNHGFPIGQFQLFKYGRALDGLNDEEFIALTKKISTYGKEGKWTTLALLFMFCFSDKEKWDTFEAYFREIIIDENMLLTEQMTDVMDSHYWSDSVIKILENGNENEFAVEITKQIVEVCAQHKVNYTHDTYIKNVLGVLTELYFKEIWDYLGEAIIGDYLLFFNLNHILESQGTTFGGRPRILFNHPENYDTMLEWCRKHEKIAPERFANMMPLDDKNESGTIWHPFSKAIIDEFGNNENVLSQLSSNMGTFGTVGSSIPYYTTQKELLTELLDNKHELVREWAAKKLEYTEKVIKRERLDEEGDKI